MANDRNIDFALRRCSAYAEASKLLHSIKVNGYTPTLRVTDDPEEKHAQAVMYVRAWLQARAHRVFPAWGYYAAESPQPNTPAP